MNGVFYILDIFYTEQFANQEWLEILVSYILAQGVNFVSEKNNVCLAVEFFWG
jgi:hypothetical protein